MFYICSINVEQLQGKYKQMIRDRHLESIRSNPLEFAEILKRMNSSKEMSVQPSTLLRRLERKSEIVKTSSIIADYLREKGLTDTKIFK
jgi:hypothetical protein